MGSRSGQKERRCVPHQSRRGPASLSRGLITKVLYPVLKKIKSHPKAVFAQDKISKVLPAKQVPQGPAQNKKGKRAPIVEETEDQKEVTQAKLINLKA